MRTQDSFLSPLWRVFGLGLGAGLICVMLWVLGWALSWADRGFDVTDDAFNYMWIKAPHDYDFAVRFHGFLLHVIDQIIGPSLVAMRRFGLLVSVLIGLLYAQVFSALMRHRGTWSGASMMAVLAACFASVMFDRVWWLLNPNYNQVASWAMAFFGLSLIWMSHLATPGVTVRRGALVGSAALLAGAGLLAFAARPPTAVAMFVLFWIYVLLFYRKALLQPTPVRRFFGLTVGWLVALFAAVSIWLITPAQFWEMLSLGASIAENRSGRGFGATHLDDLQALEWRDWVNLVVPLVTLWLLAGLGRVGPWVLAAGLGLNVLMLARAVSEVSPVFSGMGHEQIRLGFGLEALLLTLAAVAVMACLGRLRSAAVAPRDLCLIGLLLIGPLCVGIGTVNNIFIVMSAAGSLFAFAVVYAAVLGLRTLGRLVMAGASVALSVGVFLVAIAHPYHIWSPLADQNQPVTLASVGPLPLRVDTQTADFIAGLQAASAAANMPPGAPILDLTGKLPGMALLLDARAPVYPWLASDGENAPKILDFVWSRLDPQTRQEVWLIGPLEPAFEGAAALQDLLPLEEHFTLHFEAVHTYTKRNMQLWGPRATP